jgi:hypothetical protein
MKAFAEDSLVSVGDLTMERGTDRVPLYGDLDIRRDKVGLVAAEKLKALVDSVVDALRSAKIERR